MVGAKLDALGRTAAAWVQPAHFLAIAFVAGAGAALPLLLSTQRSLSIASVTLVHAAVVYGLAILFGQAGILSIAHAALWGIGAYTGALLQLHTAMSFWLAIPVGGAAAAVVAVAIGVPTLRVQGHHFLIVTFAFGELIRMAWINGRGFGTGGATGLSVGRIPPLLGFEFDSRERVYFLALGLVLVSIFTTAAVTASHFGARLRALRDNDLLAESIGIRINRDRLCVFALSGGIAGAVGVVYANVLTHIQPGLFGAFPGITLILILLIGGEATILGPLLGGFVLFFAPEVLRLDPIHRQIAYGVLLLMVVLLFREGIGGTVVRSWNEGLLGRARERARRVWRKEGERETAPIPAGSPDAARGIDGIRPVLTRNWALGAGSRPASAPALQIRGIGKRFGSLIALEDVSFDVPPQSILGVIGPNGSGKTTLFNVIAGVFPASSGSVSLFGENITDQKASEVSRLGVGRSFQQDMCFESFSVRENLRIAVEIEYIGNAPRLRRRSPVGDPRRSRIQRDQLIEGRVSAIVEWIGLSGFSEMLPSALSFGHRRRLGVGIALAGMPRVLLLDEPGAGLEDSDKGELSVLIERIRDAGVTVIIVDHDMDFVMPLSDAVVVLNAGRLVAHAGPEEVQRDPVVIESYLGDAASLPTYETESSARAAWQGNEDGS